MAVGVSQISLLSFSEMADTVDRKWLDEQKKVNNLDQIQSLYMVDSIPQGTGDRRVYDEMDSETFAKRKLEGVDARKTLVGKGYSTTMYAKRYGIEIDITAEARMFGKDREIIRRITSLSTFLPQRRALDLTHRITFATSTTYTNMDGEVVDIAVGDTLALVSAVHTLSLSATTYSNVITGNPQFSTGGFEIALGQANTQILSNFGDSREMTFDTIFTGRDPVTIRQVRQFLQSTADVDGDNPGVVNTYKGQMRHVMLYWLPTTATGAYDSTKAKYWGIVATGQWEAHLGIWEQDTLKMPAPGNNGEDPHNDDWTYGARGTWGITIVSPKGFLLSTGLGA